MEVERKEEVEKREEVENMHGWVCEQGGDRQVEG